MSPELSIDVRFYPPPEDLRRYFTTFYVTRIDVPDGGQVEDSLQPEWANLRIFEGRGPESWFDGGEPLRDVRFNVTGPSSRTCHFRVGTSRFWGIGLLPLGWHRFVGKSASDHANLTTDGHTHPSFAPFVPLADSLFGDRPDEAAELERIVRFFREFEPATESDVARTMAIHAALVDPQVDTVAKMASHVGAGQRTLERICHRDFGFSPKVLLRRQRLMRSLAHFMLDPTLKWIGAIDSQYHDQAQFVRDFREFTGMTPRAYAATPHPILHRFMQERARMLRAPVQTLDSPEGTSPEPG